MATGPEPRREDGDDGWADARAQAPEEDGVEISEVGRWIAEAALAEGGGLSGPIECESYASNLASFWESGTVTTTLGTDGAAAIGYSVIERLRRSRERAVAGQLLAGLAAVAGEPIGELADAFLGELALRPSETPPWFGSVGYARAIRAGRIEDPTTEDGAIVMVDLLWPCGERGGVSVFIDRRLGGLAKHILAGPSIDHNRAEIDAHEGRRWPFEVLSAGDAAALIGEALERTAASADPPVGPTLAPLRAFVRSQIRRIGAQLGQREAA